MHQIYAFINYSIKNHEYLYVTVHFMFMLFTKNLLYPYSSDSAHTDPSYFVGFVIIKRLRLKILFLIFENH